MFTIQNKKIDSGNSGFKKYYNSIAKPFAWIILFFSPALIFFSSYGQKELKPGQSFRDCSTCPEMVVIPSGSFLIGAPADEPGRYDEEGPQKKVNIRQFAAGKFDITLAQWAAFVSATNRITSGGCAWSGLPSDKKWDLDSLASWKYIGFPQDSTHPVVCISWDDANDYVQWLSRKTGAAYRLLTESEWEYAARAGSPTAFPWGSTASHEFSNYGADTSFGIGLALGRDQWVTTSPVGSFPPNAFGLYDMVGNVMQWVQDCFEASYQDLPTDGSAYKVNVQLSTKGDLSSMNGINSCLFRITRGGDFGDPPRFIRSASRNWAPTPGTTLHNYRSTGLGLRVAKTL